MTRQDQQVDVVFEGKKGLTVGVVLPWSPSSGKMKRISGASIRRAVPPNQAFSAPQTSWRFPQDLKCPMLVSVIHPPLRFNASSLGQ